MRRAVLFAAMHLGWVALALIVLFGMAMCLLYHWTGSLYPCVAGHAFGNAIPLAGALEWTWQVPLLIAGSTLAALILTRLLAIGLGAGHRAALEA
jgi:membrane protease YdiL (CAAX protease family)